ncbi:MAG: NADH-quinone oxidoreductase subunit B family protein [Planctomycetota bacterium]|jgi:F420-non-reducing hydrogenase small subunit
MDKPKAALYWCASCGGCEEAVVDLAEDLLKIVEAIDIVFWPVALDFKKSDVESLPSGNIAVSFINGAIRTEEQEEMVKLLREKSQLVVSFGSCSHIGGIPGLANLSNREEIFELVYKELPTVVNPENILPETEYETEKGNLTLPEFYDSVKTLNQVIDVDYYIPGCAPPAELIMDAMGAILEGKLPAKGTVLAPEKPLCDTCPRRDNKPEKIKINQIKRISLTEIGEEECFLAGGVICLGPAIRSGCGERCLNANMPCRGCFGPTKTVEDQGAKFLSALASIIDSEDANEIEHILDSVIDPVGLLYMYSLPSSIKVKFGDRKFSKQIK